MFVFGGRTAKSPENDNSDLFALNIETWIWRTVQTIGKNPSPRAFCTLNKFSNNRIILFGGKDLKQNKPLNDVFILQTSDFYWSYPFIAGY